MVLRFEGRYLYKRQAISTLEFSSRPRSNINLLVKCHTPIFTTIASTALLMGLALASLNQTYFHMRCNETAQLEI